MMGNRRPRHGFTLLEVLVALVIGGMALAGAATLFTGLGQRSDQVNEAAQRMDRDANSERLLRALLANLDLTADTMASLSGGKHSVRFSSWCLTAAGWLDRCGVHLFFNEDQSAQRLILELTGSTSLVLRTGFRSGEFRYLVDARYGGSWASTWSRIVVPAAIALIMDADTLLLPVWGSG